MTVVYDDFADTFGRSRDGLHWPEIDVLLEYFLKHSSQSESWHIADIGCWNGRLLEHISSKYLEPFVAHQTQYVGIDLSSQLLAQAQSKEASGIETQWICGNMTELDSLLPSETFFDGVFLIASFHHLADIEERKQVLKTLWTHLKPEGKIYMTNWNLIHESQARYNPSLTKNYEDGSADFTIKIWAHDRFYHAFSEASFLQLVNDAGYVSELCDFSGRNSISILR